MAILKFRGSAIAILALGIFTVFCLSEPASSGKERKKNSQKETEAPYFTNVAEKMGLGDGKGKNVTFTDLNGDGWWDVVLEKKRFYINVKGKKFKVHDSGIKWPTIKKVPRDRRGRPRLKKATKEEFTPQYLYFADFDNDGDLDMIAGVHSNWQHFNGTTWETVEACDHGQRTTIYVNNGKGKFSKARRSGITGRDNWGPSMALAIMDFNNDGLLDIYEGREYRQYGRLNGCGIDRLWKGDGNFGFTDITKKAGMWTLSKAGKKNSSRPTYGVTHGDLNNDGYQDLLQMAYGRQWNYQWMNQGNGSFKEVGQKSNFAGDDITHGKYPRYIRRRPEKPFRANGNTFDCALADYDNDGDLDCFLGEITHKWAGKSSDLPSLLINQGKDKNWKFKRVPVTELLPKRKFRGRFWNYGDMHVSWLDFDNDGLQDLLIASGDYPDGQFLRLYRQKKDHSFEEVTKKAGFNWEGCGGLSLGDYDRDGDVDILVGRSFMRLNRRHREKYLGGIKVNKCGLFRNDFANKTGNHWINIRLRGKGKGGANTYGIGARIYVTTGKRTQMREIRCGAGLSNHSNPPEAAFGLGKAKIIDRIKIVWPNQQNRVQIIKNVSADQFLVIREGESSKANK